MTTSIAHSAPTSVPKLSDSSHTQEKKTLTHIYLGLGVLSIGFVAFVEIIFLFYFPLASLIISAICSNYDLKKIGVDLKVLYQLEDHQVKKICWLTWIQQAINLAVLFISCLLVLLHVKDYCVHFIM